MNKNVLSIIGFGATIIGMGVNLISNRVDNKLVDIKIQEAVAKAVAKELKDRV